VTVATSHPSQIAVLLYPSSLPLSFQGKQIWGFATVATVRRGTTAGRRAKICPRRASSLMPALCWATSQRRATGLGQPALTPLRPRTRHVGGRFRPEPGPTQPRLGRWLRWARTAPLCSLPRVGARQPGKCGFGSSNRRSYMRNPACQHTLTMGPGKSALVWPLPGPETGATR